MVVLILFISLWGLYYLWGLVMVISWLYLKKEDNKPYEELLSVIIPFRNEEQHLISLVDSLDKLQDAHFEVLFVDDHSSDQSISVLEESLQPVQFPYRILTAEAEGKKQAIKKGINESKGSIIIQTDADCIVPDKWLSAYRQLFGNSQNELVFGAVKYKLKGFWSQVMQTELSALILVGAAMLNLKKPNMCNGANIGFRKKVFEEVKGYEGNEHLASGDDEFLMHKVFQKKPGAVQFLNDSEAVIITQAPETISSFVNQRIRWSSKWKAYELNYIKWLPIFLTFLYGSLLLTPWIPLKVSLNIIFYKFVVDLLLIYFVNRFLKVKLNLFAFMISFLGYPCYLLYFAIASNKSKYTWKSRLIRNG